MGRPRATAATAASSRPRRNPKPKRDPSFLSPLASPAPASRTRTRKPAVRRRGGSSPASSSPGSSPADLSISFLSSPESSASPPKPKPKPRARAKPAARSPLVASPRVAGAAGASPSPAASPQPASAAAAAAPAGMSSVGDLRSGVASQMEDLKRRLEALHSRAHSDLDASFSRVSKRIKARSNFCFQTQTKACQQLTDEADKEYKKVSDNIKESSEIVKAKHKQIIADAQSSTTRACKVTIPEITKSVEKAIDGLRSRYNISMAA
ncbi:hypothetical protein HU200_041254 [Digitaria exilis]|uniref:Uncharacterized protein n=1 Tax=Digitaria exilis TaxID=1010633 RepID=A0A835B875_9POAL|nr:hypothetical protein HU200_041254 [Digitaria exilis]